MTRKDALMVAAKELFGTYGYANTTFKKISEQAGVALGLLAHHYGTKENLFLIAGMEVVDNLVAKLEQESSAGKTGFERTMLFCRAYLDVSLAENSYYTLLLRSSPYSITSMEGPASLMQSFARVHELLELLLAQGVEDKTISIPAPSLTRQVIVSTLIGGCRTRLLSPYASASLYEDILEFIDKGISA